MARKYYTKERLEAEKRYLAQRIDLEDLMEREGWQITKGTKGSRNNREYKNESFSFKIAVKTNPSKTSYAPKIWTVPGNSEAMSGNVFDFVNIVVMNNSKRGGQRVEVYDFCRLFALDNFGAEYRANFPEVENVDLSKAVRARVEVAKPVEQAPLKLFKFEPIKNYDFLINRGLSEDVLKNQLFIDRFGNARGPFAPNEKGVSTYKQSEQLQFKEHLIIPYWDAEGRVLALEAKNVLNAKGVSNLIAEAKELDESPDKIRKTPSIFYEGSQKGLSIWRSNIPKNPSRIALFESPIDALSYYQLHIGKDPQLDSTIYISPAGSFSEEQYNIILGIAQQYNIKNFMHGFDLDHAGIRYIINANDKLYGLFNKDERPIYTLSSTTPNSFVMIVSVNTNFTKEQLSNPNTSEFNKLLADTNAKTLPIIESLLNKHGLQDIALIKKDLTGKFRIADIQLYIINSRLKTIASFVSELSGMQNFIDVKFPEVGKDWNDQLRGIENKSTDVKAIPLLSLDSRFNKPIGIKSNFEVALYDNLPAIRDLNPSVAARFNYLNSAQPFSVSAKLMSIIDKEVEQQIKGIFEHYKGFIGPFNNARISKALMMNTNMYFVNNNIFLNGSNIGSVVNGKIELNENGKKIYPTPESKMRSPLFWMEESLKYNGSITQIKFTSNQNSLTLGGANAKLVVQVGKNDWKVLATFDPFRMTFNSSNGDFNKLEELKPFIPQMRLIQRDLENYKVSWNKLLSEYPVYTDKLKGVNKQLFSSRKFESVKDDGTRVIAEYNDKTNMLEWNKEIVTSGQINIYAQGPLFWNGALSFLENKGYYRNIAGELFVDALSNNIYFKNSNYKVGSVFKDDNGQDRIYLIPGLSKLVSKELKNIFGERIAEYSIASLYLSKEQLESKYRMVSDNRVSEIPEHLKEFFDKGRFISKTDEEIQKLRDGKYALYFEAEMYNVNFIEYKQSISSNVNTGWRVEGESLFFYSIQIARYDSVKDTVNVESTLDVKKDKINQAIATFEQAKVKKFENRKYHQYLVDANKSSEVKVDFTGDISVLRSNVEKVDSAYYLKNGDAYIKLAEKSGELLLTNSHATSDIFGTAISDLLKDIAKLENATIRIVDFEQSRINIKEEGETINEVVKPSAVIKQELKIHPLGVHYDILAMLGKEISYDASDIYINTMPKDGKISEINLYEASKKEGYGWRAGNTKANNLIIGETPLDAIKALQDGYSRIIPGDFFVGSFPGLDDNKIKKLIVDFVKHDQANKRIILSGGDNFVRSLKIEFDKENIIVTGISPSTFEDINRKINRSLSQILPNKDIELLPKFDNLGYPAEGIIRFVTKSAEGNSFAYLGKTLKDSPDPNALFFSNELRKSTQLVLAPTIEEAYYYMQLNRKFIDSMMVIGMQEKVTESMIKEISKIAQFPTFKQNITIANTKGLQEKIENASGLKGYNLKIFKPATSSSYAEEYHRVSNSNVSVKVREELEAANKTHLIAQRNATLDFKVED